MARISNPKHDAFAVLVAKGKAVPEAYVLAGYKASHVNSYRLYKQMRERIDELRNRYAVQTVYIDRASTERAINRLSLNKEALAREMLWIAGGNIADFTVLLPDGQRAIDFTNTTREQLGAIASITVDTHMEGRGEAAVRVTRTKITLHPKIAAAMAVAKLVGWVDQVRGSADQLEERLRAMTPEQREQHADELYERVQARLAQVREEQAEDEAEARGGIGAEGSDYSGTGEDGGA